jgi:hypothetical protein
MKDIVEFIFPKRLHRFAYFVRIISINGMTYVVCSWTTTNNPGFLIASLIALLLYGFFFVALPRVRDLGMSGWWLLASLVPLLNIWLGLILLFRAPSYATKRVA